MSATEARANSPIVSTGAPPFRCVLTRAASARRPDVEASPWGKVNPGPGGCRWEHLAGPRGAGHSLLLHRPGPGGWGAAVRGPWPPQPAVQRHRVAGAAAPVQHPEGAVRSRYAELCGVCVPGRLSVRSSRSRSTAVPGPRYVPVAGSSRPARAALATVTARPRRRAGPAGEWGGWTVGGQGVGL
jgi:hypothetical protein